MADGFITSLTGSSNLGEAFASTDPTMPTTAFSARIRIEPTTWTRGTEWFPMSMDGPNGDRAMRIGVGGDNKVRLLVFPDGTFGNRIVYTFDVVNEADGVGLDMRVDWTGDNGSGNSEASLFKRTIDEAVSLEDDTGWTQISTTKTDAVATLQDIGRGRVLSSQQSGTVMLGKFWRAILIDGTAGTATKTMDLDVRVIANRTTAGQNDEWDDQADGAITWTWRGTEDTDWSYTEPTSDQVDKSASDTATVSVGEQVAILGSLDRADSLTLSLLEQVAILAELTRTDDVTVGVAEDAALLVPVVASDDVTLSLAEQIALLASLDRTDDLNLSLAEAVTIAALLDASDSIALSVDELAAIAVTLSGSDTVSIALAEAVDVIALLDRSDAVQLTLAESPAILATLERTDAVNVSLAEVVDILAAVAATDDVTVSLAEAAAIVNAVSASDTIDLAVLESVPDIEKVMAAVIKLGRTPLKAKLVGLPHLIRGRED